MYSLVDCQIGCKPPLPGALTFGRLYQDERIEVERATVGGDFFCACGDMRVLIVEDDPDLNKQLCSALDRAGYIVESAREGEHGHFLADTSDFDAVILDLGLPVMKGTEVLRKWRDAGRMMPVLILTAEDFWSNKVSLIDAGADDYLAKPFHMAELLARVRAPFAEARVSPMPCWYAAR